MKTVYYSYAIRDRDEREVLVYQWHPEGVSDVTFPHLHISRSAPIPLARTDPPRTVAIGRMHLPTNHVRLDDLDQHSRVNAHRAQTPGRLRIEVGGDRVPCLFQDRRLVNGGANLAAWSRQQAEPGGAGGCSRGRL